MGYALRQTVEKPDDSNAGEGETFAQGRTTAASPVHNLHDMLARRLCEEPVAPARLAPQARMAFMFWIAMAAWGVVLAAAYAIGMLF